MIIKFFGMKRKFQNDSCVGDDAGPGSRERFSLRPGSPFWMSEIYILMVFSCPHTRKIRAQSIASSSPIRP